MHPYDAATILHFHQRLREENPRSGFRAVGWVKKSEQQIRFAQLLQIGDLAGRTVLDLGCGYGGLRAYLQQQNIPCSYLGIDLNPAFITGAKIRFRDVADTQFMQADFTQVQLPAVDFVLASGALSYHIQEEDWHLRMIEKMVQAGRMGIAFNLLDAAGFQDTYYLRSFEPKQLLDFCLNLAPSACLVQGYLTQDFTILIQK